MCAEEWAGGRDGVLVCGSVRECVGGGVWWVGVWVGVWVVLLLLLLLLLLLRVVWQ